MCRTCGGNRIIPSGTYTSKPCKICSGSGFIGNPCVNAVCTACNGNGCYYVYTNLCPTCMCLKCDRSKNLCICNS